MLAGRDVSVVTLAELVSKGFMGLPPMGQFKDVAKYFLKMMQLVDLIKKIREGVCALM